EKGVTYDGRSLIINGQRMLLFSDFVHYPRSPPRFNFEGNYDLIKFIKMIRRHDMMNTTTMQINTCNGRYCGDTLSGPNSPNKPTLWTENWTAQTSSSFVTTQYYDEAPIDEYDVSQLKSAEPLKHFSTTKVTTVSLESYLEHRVATEVIFKFNFRHFSLDCTFGTLLDVYEYE
ncbi:beta-galactosidase 13-like protein, partial [Trifolium pratense]